MALPFAIPAGIEAIKILGSALAHTGAITGLGLLGKEVYDNYTENNTPRKSEEERAAEISRTKDAVLAMPAIDRMSRIKNRSSVISVPSDNTYIERGILLKRRKKSKKANNSAIPADTPVETPTEEVGEVVVVGEADNSEISDDVDNVAPEIETNEGSVTEESQTSSQESEEQTPEENDSEENDEESEKPKDKKTKIKEKVKETTGKLKSKGKKWGTWLGTAAGLDLGSNLVIGIGDENHMYNPYILKLPFKALNWIYNTSGMDNLLNSETNTSTGTSTSNSIGGMYIPAFTKELNDSIKREISKRDSLFVNRGYKK